MLTRGSNKEIVKVYVRDVKYEKKVSSYDRTFTENVVIKESFKCNFMFYKMFVNFIQHKLRRSVYV